MNLSLVNEIERNGMETEQNRMEWRLFYLDCIYAKSTCVDTDF